MERGLNVDRPRPRERLNRQDAKSAKRNHEGKDTQSGVFNRKRRKDVKPGVSGWSKRTV
jgi:hypothetical protein